MLLGQQVKRYVIGFILGCLLVGAIWYWTGSGKPPEVVQLPPEVVEKIVYVETVKEIPGPETVIERVKWRTREVPVDRPIIQEVVKVVERAVELDSLFADIEINADKHLGKVGDRIVAGWVGNAACRVRAEPSAPWTELVREMFHVEHSTAISEIAPTSMIPRRLPRLFEVAAGLTSSPGARLDARWYGQGRRWGIYLAGDWVPDPDRVTALLGPQNGPYDNPTVSTYKADSFVVAGGLALRFGGK